MIPHVFTLPLFDLAIGPFGDIKSKVGGQSFPGIIKSSLSDMFLEKFLYPVYHILAES